MENYLELSIGLAEQDEQEIWVARLAEAGFEGFEEQENHLLAFAPQSAIALDEVKVMLQEAGVPFEVSVKLPKNWNEVWESSFEPVLIDDFVSVRAAFHPVPAKVKYDLVITPKMSFGTGHHPTTRLMIQQMKQLDFGQKRVTDFGTGTGVLAILASKMGAVSVEATDIDTWSIENALENAAINACAGIRFEQTENLDGVGEADIFLANINKNILRQFAKTIGLKTAPGGYILLSGLLEEDEMVIDYSFISIDIEKVKVLELDGWISILYRKLVL